MEKYNIIYVKWLVVDGKVVPIIYNKDLSKFKILNKDEQVVPLLGNSTYDIEANKKVVAYFASLGKRASFYEGIKVEDDKIFWIRPVTTVHIYDKQSNIYFKSAVFSDKEYTIDRISKLANKFNNILEKKRNEKMNKEKCIDF